MLNVGNTLVLYSNIIHQNMESILGTENYVVKYFLLLNLHLQIWHRNMPHSKVANRKGNQGWKGKPRLDEGRRDLLHISKWWHDNFGCWVWGLNFVSFLFSLCIVFEILEKCYL